MKSIGNKKLAITFSLAALLQSLAANPVISAPLDWDGSTGNWNTDASWLPGGTEPTAADDAGINAGTVTVSMNGEVADTLRVALTGNGNLLVVSGGSLSSSTGFVGTSLGSTGTATISGPSANWTNAGNLSVGNSGSGTLTVESGGGVVNSADSFLGVNGSANGSATVTGAGSTLSTAGLYVGFNGTGVLDVLNGGAVTSNFGFVGRNAGSNGTATVSGAGSSWHSSVLLSVGANPVSPNGVGHVTTSSGGSLYIGDAATSHAGSTRLVISDADPLGDEFTGLLAVNAGSTLTHGGAAYLGYGTSESGTAVISGAGAQWSNAGNLYVGFQGTGLIEVTNGATVNQTGLGTWLGEEAGSSGTLTVDGVGSHWNNNFGALFVGNDGNGTLMISNGGAVSNTYGHVGSDAEGEATVTGAGSTWTNSNYLLVGQRGNGTLSILDGASVSNSTFATIGEEPGSNGVVTVSDVGSSWTSTNTLTIGNRGNATLNVSNGGSVQANGNLIAEANGGTAVLNFTIASLSDPFMDVAGNATLAGALGVSLDPGLTLSDGDTFTLIDIGATQSGTFSNAAQGGLLGTFGGVDLFLTYTGGDGNDVVAYADERTVREWVGGAPGGPPDLYTNPANWSGGTAPDTNDINRFITGGDPVWNATTGNTESGDMEFLGGTASISSIGGPYTHTIHGSLYALDTDLTIDNMNLVVEGEAEFSSGPGSPIVTLQGQSVLTADLLEVTFDVGELIIDGPDAKVNIANSTTVDGGQTALLRFENGSVNNTVGELSVLSIGGNDAFLEVLSGSKVTATDVTVSADGALTYWSEARISGSGSELIQTGASTFTLGDGVFIAGSGNVFEGYDRGETLLYVTDSGKITTGTGLTTIDNEATALINGGEFQINGDLLVNGDLFVGYNPNNGDTLTGLVEVDGDITVNALVKVGDTFRAWGDTLTINGSLSIDEGELEVDSDIVVNGDLTFDVIDSSPLAPLVWSPGHTMTIQGSGAVDYYVLPQPFYSMPTNATIIVNGNTTGINWESDGISIPAGSRLLLNSGLILADEISLSGTGAELIVNGPDSDIGPSQTGTFLFVSQGLLRFENAASIDLPSIDMTSSSGESRTEVLSGSSLTVGGILVEPGSTLLVSGAGSSVDTGTESLLIGSDSAIGSALAEVSDSAALTIGTGGITVKSNGTLKLDNGSFTANGDIAFTGGTLHYAITTGSEPALQANAGLTIGSGSTLKVELDPGLNPVVNDSFDIISSANPIGTMFDSLDGQAIGGGLYFEQVITPSGPGSVLRLVVMQTFPADLDLDGDVDGVDLSLMFANFNGPGGGPPTNPQADLDGDNDVDGVDLSLAFGTFTGPLSTTSIPEPGSLVSFGLLGLLGALRRRRLTI